jgi:two-component system chemotaxis sensor kinase CheA
MSEHQDDSLLQDFLSESAEHLESIEPDLLALEKQAPEVSQEIVNRIFRAIHSIKGASGFFGFERLKQVSHLMESVLMRVRDGVLIPHPHVVEPLLMGVDLLNVMVEDIQRSERLDTSALEEALTHYTKADTPYLDGPASLTLAQPVQHTEESKVRVHNEKVNPSLCVESDSIEKAKRLGQFVYVAKLDTNLHLFDMHRSYKDFIGTIDSIGVVLASTVSEQESDAPPPNFHVVFATVLEKDLVLHALDIAESQLDDYEVPVVDESVYVEQTDAEFYNKTAEIKVEAPSASNAEVSYDTLRVRVDLLNTLMDFAGELVLARNQLMRAVQSDKQLGTKNESFVQVLESINTVTNQLQDHIMQTRMQPIENVFRRFPRVVRDLAKQLNKKIQLQMIGQDVELDKSILEGLSDPLTHMIRNACDHGIESPEQRKAAGKSPSGTITLHAFHEAGQIHLRIEDDGKGIDTEALGRKAIANGVMSQAEFDDLSHQEKLNLIFHAGLSTAEAVTDLSGRGVGMDVVRANIEALGGHVYLESTLGKGSAVILQLPLTLAIIPCLVVGVGEERFAVPRVNLLELVRVKANEVHQRIERIGQASVLRLRGNWLPLVKLADVLNLRKPNEARRTIEDARFNDPIAIEQIPEIRRQSPESDYTLLVLSVGINQYGLIVDEAYDIEDIVVKPLSTLIKNVHAFSGTTIMGDGSVAMICDVVGIATQSELDFSGVQTEHLRRQELEKQRSSTSIVDGFEFDPAGNLLSPLLEKQSVLLFQNHPQEPFAVPLAEVLRLEYIKAKKIESVGHREFVRMHNETISIIRLEQYLNIRTPNLEDENGYLILPLAGKGKVGIWVAEIIDSLEVDYRLDTDLIEEPCLYGSALIQERVTLLLNINALLKRAGVEVHPSLAGAF